MLSTYVRPWSSVRARGQADEWSDIDVVIVARHFDGEISRADIN